MTTRSVRPKLVRATRVWPSRMTSRCGSAPSAASTASQISCSARLSDAMSARSAVSATTSRDRSRMAMRQLSHGGHGPMTDNPTVTLLNDAFGRVRELVQGLTDGLDDHAATFRVDGEANTPTWLLWHLTRIQDDHVADLARVEQAWTWWRDRFDLP